MAGQVLWSLPVALSVEEFSQIPSLCLDKSTFFLNINKVNYSICVFLKNKMQRENLRVLYSGNTTVQVLA